MEHKTTLLSLLTWPMKESLFFFYIQSPLSKYLTKTVHTNLKLSLILQKDQLPSGQSTFILRTLLSLKKVMHNNLLTVKKKTSNKLFFNTQTHTLTLFPWCSCIPSREEFLLFSLKMGNVMFVNLSFCRNFGERTFT